MLLMEKAIGNGRTVSSRLINWDQGGGEGMR